MRVCYFPSSLWGGQGDTTRLRLSDEEILHDLVKLIPITRLNVVNKVTHNGVVAQSLCRIFPVACPAEGGAALHHDAGVHGGETTGGLLGEAHGCEHAGEGLSLIHI